MKSGIHKIPIRLLEATILTIAPVIALCVNIAIQTTNFSIEFSKNIAFMN